MEDNRCGSVLMRSVLLDYRSEECGGEQEAAEGDGHRVRGGRQGAEEGQVDREEGRVLALRAVQSGGSAVCCSGLRQEGPSRLRQECGGSRQHCHRYQVRRGRPVQRPRVQRREPERLLRHVNRRGKSLPRTQPGFPVKMAMIMLVLIRVS